MAIYSASVKVISRAAGRSATGAAAYRAGVSLTDARSGLTHDYTRKSGVVSSEILLPALAPAAMRDRSTLWNAAEAAEVRKDARTARELILALPHELGGAGRAAAARKVGQWLVDRYGVAADVSIHKPDRMGDERNHHAHILFTVRAVGKDGMGAKTRALDDRTKGAVEIEAIREAWEQIANTALAAAGSAERIDRRSHKELGIELPPQIHEGVRATQMRRRGAKIRESAVVVDFKGREIDYPAIDQGHTRAEHNAEIINLQKYRDTLDEQHEQSRAEREELQLEQQIGALQERAQTISGSIESLEAALGNLGNSAEATTLRARLWNALEQAFRITFFRRQLEQQIEQRHELDAQREELKRVHREIAALEEQKRATRAMLDHNRELFAKVKLMPARLNGIPPYDIKLAVPPSAAFNEAATRSALHRQSTASLERGIDSPPTKAARPEMATVALRQDVLQVKELLSRSKPRPRATEQGAYTAADIGAALRRKKV